ncbi:MAG: response regulator [bacterium]|nr:response regulator [bacterium]
MAKIMLVEDDDNLRQIYEDSLKAEGHVLVTAGDGEEALALAVKEKPDLILADIMMPKVSGFDMLDILRTTPETKDAKIVMMTALSQAEDKARAEKLGADKYLVKSQVTLQDVMKIIDDMLGQETAATNQAVAQMIGGSTTAAPVAPPAPTQSSEPMPIKEQTSQVTPQEVPPAQTPQTPPTKIDVLGTQPESAPDAASDSGSSGGMMTSAPTMAQGGSASQPADEPQSESPNHATPTIMKHEKRLEPTADMLSQGPKITEMLTNNNEPAVSPPSVDSVITPDGTQPPVQNPSQNGLKTPPVAPTQPPQTPPLVQ